MSFNISSVGPAEAKPIPSTGAPRATRSTAAPPPASNDSVTVDTIPSSPPPEVHEAIGVAGDVYAKLKASGRQLSFQIDDRTGKLHIEVHDLKGQVLFTVPPAKALEIASGGSLD